MQKHLIGKGCFFIIEYSNLSEDIPIILNIVKHKVKIYNIKQLKIQGEITEAHLLYNLTVYLSRNNNITTLNNVVIKYICSHYFLVPM